MHLSSVTADLATALGAIDGLRVFPYWPDRITPPTAVVSWPDALLYDATMVRGADRAELEVTVMVGKADVRSAWDQLSAYADGNSASSVKAAVERHLPIAYDSARVTRVAFGITAVAGVDYLASTFTLDIIGSGG